MSVVKLPPLRKIDYSKKRYHYHLKDSATKRRRAIREGVRQEMKENKRTQRQAAISKKGRFNTLRIYRKNKDPEGCKILTEDMKYMDKLYKLGTTKDICRRKRKTRRKQNTRRKRSR